VEVREVKGFAARIEASRARVIPMTRPRPAGAAA
jgi:hypothetical protein